MIDMAETVPPAEQVAATSLVPSARRRLAAGIAGSLTGPGAPGALVVGGPGTGKTTLARHVLDQLGAGIHVERVRGGATVSAIPYGAIHYLLSEVELQVLAHPIHVVPAVARLLCTRAGGLPIVVFVVNTELLDEQAAATLAQLAADGTLSLLACAEDASRIPAGFAGLRRNGLLHRVDLPAFGFAEAVEWLGAALGGAVSGQAAHELWAESGGNPLLLATLAGEWMQAGLLDRQEGTWYLAEGAGAPAAGLGGVRPAKLAGLEPGQRILLEILAMAGSLPMELVRQVGTDADFDELHSRGIAVLDGGLPAMVSLPDRLLGELIRRQLRPERSRQLLELVLGAGGWEAAGQGRSGSGWGTLALARWALECGVPLVPAQALAAARAALEAGDPGLALRLAPPATGCAATTAVRAEAHLARHDVPAAAAVLAAFDDAAEIGNASAPEQGTGTDAEWLGLLPIRCRVARAQPATAGRAAGLLAAAAERLGSAPGHPEVPVLELAAAEQALHEGRIRDLSLERLQGCLHDADPRLRQGAAVLLAQAYGETGRAADAERLGLELAGRFHLTGTGPGSADDAAADLREQLRSQGMWDGYARLLGPLQGRPALRDPELWAQADIAAGLKLAEAGQPQAALAVLLPAAGRLRQSGGSPLLPLAAAGCAFACALLQDQPGVLAHLAACSETGGHVPWSVRAAVRYYAAMAQATTGSYAAAAAELLREADRAQANGALAAALRFASGAARLGGTGAADRLAALAEHVPGPFAQACGSFGAGLAAGNAAALVDAAGHAAGEGLNVFAREAARLALVLASGSGDTGLMRVAQKYVYTDSAGFDFCVGRLGGGQPLTLREQEVAELVAAGQSNADIARHFGVSVRTVEGHLYKLYAKLQPKFEPVAGGLATGRKTHG